MEMTDFEKALSEVKPAFGAVTETLEQYRLNGIIDSGQHFKDTSSTLKNLVEQVCSQHAVGSRVCTMQNVTCCASVQCPDWMDGSDASLDLLCICLVT